MNSLFSLATLISCLPTIGKYLGFITPDVVPLNAEGKTWNSVSDKGTEPIYTKQKPTQEGFFFSLAAAFMACRNL